MLNSQEIIGLVTSPPSFVTKTPPNIDDNTVIVAVASPDLETGVQSRNGRFLSDFYAFNYLFKGLGHSQTWLTAADPERLLETYGNYLHGNPYQEQKVVLSSSLLQNGEITPPVVVEPQGMIDRFLNEVERASAEAAQHDRLLLIMVFFHGLVDHRFLLDASDDERGLEVNRLREAIADGCRATILTPACYAEGWIGKDLTGNNQHPLSATPGKQSESWVLSPSASKRAYGSIFVSSVIATLVSKGNPLVAAEDDDEEDGGGEASDGKEIERLQPDRPNEIQAEAYRSFCWSILDTCLGKLHRMAYDQGLCFSAQDDQWSWPWIKRTGTPLAQFQSRWDALETVKFSGDEAQRLFGDPDDSNDWGPSSQTSDPEVQKRMEDLVHQQRVPPLAKLLLETCPGDWSRCWVSMMPLSNEKAESLANEILEYTGRLRKGVEEGVATNEGVPARADVELQQSVERPVGEDEEEDEEKEEDEDEEEEEDEDEKAEEGSDR
ncbi:uncharacterized protein N0V96_008449 [Colletotrichum fioriniae]|uniref:uncharacterized protein n=1 Tax=Colletotrichum fioriniae TaxID=710243 RepID=UPI0032DAF0C5|nr:hypothetical protein N0V96_008449 [Colletotrichum fioriniae]